MLTRAYPEELLPVLTLAHYAGLVGPILGPVLGGVLVTGKLALIFLINIPIGAVQAFCGRSANICPTSPRRVAQV